jgi:class 3 adenylate cyclase
VLTTCIRELRQVLGDAVKTPQYIATVHGQGYRFIAPVTVTEAPPRSVPAAPPQTPLPPPSTPATALPARTGLVLDAEYKLVTVLCGALEDAPALATRLGPEGWYRLLQTVVGLVQDVLQPYDGTLTLSTSEGFTVVFGVPVAQEDHARRAVLAAWELHQRLRQHPALGDQSPDGRLALRLGLHSGRVVVGRLGQAPQHGDTAVGAPLHVATRLQQQAAPGTTLLSAVTYRLVQAEVQATPCGPLALAEQSTPLPVYAVQGLRGRYAGVVGRSLRAASPFVGRARELALLQDCLAAAMMGQGQAVTLYVGQCLSYGQTSPYLPVREILRQVCGIIEEDEDATHLAAVQHQLHVCGLSAEADVALLLQLLDLPVALECLAPLSPQARHARTFALLRHLVLHAAQQQPLILAVENLHWSDPTSAAWLASMVERMADAAVLLVVTYRPGYQPPWGTHSSAMQAALAPLPAQESRAVVQAILGSMPLPEARLREMVTRAGGNPFFLEELAWHAVEQGRSNTPEAVHTVLAARMDRLPPEAKRLLQTAAVIGTEVPCTLLQAIARQPEEALHHSLTHLQTAEFLSETRLFPDQVYTFKHALTHEMAYGSLLQERRWALHAQIVTALETLAGDRWGEQVDRLAHHTLRGEVWAKAVTYCQQAGARAYDRAAFREAVVYFEQALKALAHLSEPGDTRMLAIELRLALGYALNTLEEYGRCLALLGKAEALARALDDRAQRRRSASPRWKAEGLHRAWSTPGSATSTSSKGIWSRAEPSVVLLATGTSWE